MSLTKLTKAQLIENIEEQEETKFDNFKVIFGMPYETEDEWIDYIKRLQDTNGKLLNDVMELTERLSLQTHQLNDYLNNSIR